jgi:hypothetical protein
MVPIITVQIEREKNRTVQMFDTTLSSRISWEKGCWCNGWRRYSAHPHPFLQQASGQIFKDDVYGISSTSDICSLHGIYVGRSGPSQEPHRGETSAYYLMIMHIYPGLTPGKMD